MGIGFDLDGIYPSSRVHSTQYYCIEIAQYCSYLLAIAIISMHTKKEQTVEP